MHEQIGEHLQRVVAWSIVVVQSEIVVEVNAPTLKHHCSHEQDTVDDYQIGRYGSSRTTCHIAECHDEFYVFWCKITTLSAKNNLLAVTFCFFNHIYLKIS